MEEQAGPVGWRESIRHMNPATTTGSPVQATPEPRRGRDNGVTPGRWDHAMDETRIRQQVCDAGHQLWLRRMVCGDGGVVTAELNRRRFIVTPVGKRRADLKPEQLLCIDLTGTDALAADRALPEDVWRPHRLAYQGSMYVESTGDGSGRTIHATALATPPNVMALHCLHPTTAAIRIIGHDDLPVVQPDDDKAVQRAVLATPLILLHNIGVLATDRTVEACLNRLETLEHHAAIELATAGFRE